MKRAFAKPTKENYNKGLLHTKRARKWTSMCEYTSRRKMINAWHFVSVMERQLTAWPAGGDPGLSFGKSINFTLKIIQLVTTAIVSFSRCSLTFPPFFIWKN